MYNILNAFFHLQQSELVNVKAQLKGALEKLHGTEEALTKAKAHGAYLSNSIMSNGDKGSIKDRALKAMRE